MNFYVLMGSLYNIRLGAELLFNLGDNAIGCLTSFTWTIMEAMAAEKIPDIRAIHNQAIVGMNHSYCMNHTV